MSIIKDKISPKPKCHQKLNIFKNQMSLLLKQCCNKKNIFKINQFDHIRPKKTILDHF